MGKDIAVVVNTKADLDTARVGDGDLVQTLGYHSSGDGGGNLFQYDADSTASVDDGWVISGPSAVGRYLALDQTVADIRHFGVRLGSGNEVSNRTSFQSALNSANSVYIPKGTWRVDCTGGNPLQIGTGTTLKGDGYYSWITPIQTDGSATLTDTGASTNYVRLENFSIVSTASKSNVDGIRVGDISGETYSFSRFSVENVQLWGLATAWESYGWVVNIQNLFINQSTVGFKADNLNGGFANVQIENCDQWFDLDTCNGTQFNILAEGEWQTTPSTIDDCEGVSFDGLYLEYGAESITETTFTVNSSTDVCTTPAAHGFSDGDIVYVTTDGTAPSPLFPQTARHKYIVTNSQTVSTEFQLTHSDGSTIVNFTDTGTGEHTIHRSNEDKTLPMIRVGQTTACAGMTVEGLRVAISTTLDQSKCIEVYGLHGGSFEGLGGINGKNPIVEFMNNGANVSGVSCKYIDTVGISNESYRFGAPIGGAENLSMENRISDPFWHNGLPTVSTTSCTSSVETTTTLPGRPRAMRLTANTGVGSFRADYSLSLATGNASKLVGEEVTVGTWVYAPSAYYNSYTNPYVFPYVYAATTGAVSNATSSSASSAQHVVDGWAFITTTLTIPSDATGLDISFRGANTSTEAHSTGSGTPAGMYCLFGGVIAVVGGLSTFQRLRNGEFYTPGEPSTVTGGNAVVAENVAALSGLTPDDNGRVHLQGYYTAGDGGGQDLVYKATGRSGITVDSGFYFQGGGADDYFVSIDIEVAHADNFGALPSQTASVVATRIQAALTASNTVQLGAYTYSTDRKISVGTGKTLIGSGYNTVISYDGTSDTTALECSSVSEVTVSNLVLRGTTERQSGDTGLTLSGCTNSVFTRIWCEDFDTGVSTATSTGNVLEVRCEDTNLGLDSDGLDASVVTLDCEDTAKYFDLNNASSVNLKVSGKPGAGASATTSSAIDGCEQVTVENFYIEDDSAGIVALTVGTASKCQMIDINLRAGANVATDVDLITLDDVDGCLIRGVTYREDNTNLVSTTADTKNLIVEVVENDGTPEAQAVPVPGDQAFQTPINYVPDPFFWYGLPSDLADTRCTSSSDYVTKLPGTDRSMKVTGTNGDTNGNPFAAWSLSVAAHHQLQNLNGDKVGIGAWIYVPATYGPSSFGDAGPSLAVTATYSNDVFLPVAAPSDTLQLSVHGFKVNDVVTLSGSDLPAGYSAGDYYVVDVLDGSTFKLSATEGGAAITHTDNGSGSRYVQLKATTSTNVSTIWKPGEWVFAVSEIDTRSRLASLDFSFYAMRDSATITTNTIAHLGGYACWNGGQKNAVKATNYMMHSRPAKWQLGRDIYYEQPSPYTSASSIPNGATVNIDTARALSWYQEVDSAATFTLNFNNMEAGKEAKFVLDAGSNAVITAGNFTWMDAAPAGMPSGKRYIITAFYIGATLHAKWELDEDNLYAYQLDGGSDGQVLTKTSSTDGEWQWETPSGGGGGAGTPEELTYSQDTEASSSTIDIDADDNMSHITTLATNPTVTVSNLEAGQTVVWYVNGAFTISPSGWTWWNKVASTATGPGVLDGTDYTRIVFEKVGATTYGTWSNREGNPIIPSGGSANHYVRKASGTDYDYEVGELDISDDATPSLGGPLDASSNIVKLSKGADVASASALTLGNDGNYFDITGTTSITSIVTKGAGTTVVLQFDAILTLTHNATSLDMPTGSSVTTAAGDHAAFVEYSTGNWRCLWYTRADGTPLAGGGGGGSLPTGGSKGQILAKDTATDGDASWYSLGYIDVKRVHGAVGDGSTDDLAALQAAVDDAIVTGKTVYIPAGSYAISDVLDLGTSTGQKLTIIGDGPESTNIIPTTGNTATYLARIDTDSIASPSSTRRARGYNIKGINFDCLNTARCDFGLHIDLIEHSDFEDVWFQNAGVAGILIKTGWSNSFKQCRSWASLNHGWVLGLNTSPNAWNSNTFTNCKATGNTGIGVYMEGGQSNSWVGGDIEQNALTGLWLNATNAFHCMGTYFEQNGNTGHSFAGQKNVNSGVWYTSASKTIKADVILNGSSTQMTEATGAVTNLASAEVPSEGVTFNTFSDRASGVNHIAWLGASNCRVFNVDSTTSSSAAEHFFFASHSLASNIDLGTVSGNDHTGADGVELFDIDRTATVSRELLSIHWAHNHYYRDYVEVRPYEINLDSATSVLSGSGGTLTDTGWQMEGMDLYKLSGVASTDFYGESINPGEFPQYLGLPMMLVCEWYQTTNYDDQVSTKYNAQPRLTRVHSGAIYDISSVKTPTADLGSTTGTTTASSATIASVVDTTGFVPGGLCVVEAANSGSPAGAFTSRIVSVVSNTSITLADAVPITVAGATLRAPAKQYSVLPFTFPTTDATDDVDLGAQMFLGRADEAIYIQRLVMVPFGYKYEGGGLQHQSKYVTSLNTATQVTFDETDQGQTLSGAVVLDTSTDLEFYGTATAGITVSLTGMENGKVVRFYVDGMNYTITPSGWSWADGAGPGPLNAVNKYLITFVQSEGSILAYHDQPSFNQVAADDDTGAWDLTATAGVTQYVTLTGNSTITPTSFSNGRVVKLWAIANSGSYTVSLTGATFWDASTSVTVSSTKKTLFTFEQDQGTVYVFYTQQS